MPDTLTDTIARELGIDAEKAAAMLETFGRQCREQAEAGLPTPLPHVGELRRRGRTVTFTPAESLVQALQQRHSDLALITVDVPASAADDDASSEEASERQAIAFAPTPPAPAETPEQAPPPRSPSEASTESAPTAPSEEAVADASEEDLTAASSSKQDRRPSAPSRGRRILVGVLVAFVLLVASAALAFFLVYDGKLANLPFTVPGITWERTATTPPAAPPDTSSAVIPVEPSPVDTAAAATDTTTPPPSPSITPSDGGWTIIVGAYQTRPEADSLLTVFRNRFSDETLPVDVLTAEGTTRFRHRIAVGQYDSQEAAVAARTSLGGQLPPDAWILRLQ